MAAEDMIVDGTHEAGALDLFKRSQAGDLWAARELARLLAIYRDDRSVDWNDGSFTPKLSITGTRIMDFLSTKFTVTRDAIMHLLGARLIEAADKKLYGADYYAALFYYLNTISSNQEPRDEPWIEFQSFQNPLLLLCHVKACVAIERSDLPHPIKKFAQTEKECLKILFAFERGTLPEWYRQNADNPVILAIEEIVGRPEFGDQTQLAMHLIFSDKTISKQRFVIQKILQQLYHIIKDKCQAFKNDPALLFTHEISKASNTLARLRVEIPTLSLESMGTWFTGELRKILAGALGSYNDSYILRGMLSSICESGAFNFDAGTLNFLVGYYLSLYTGQNDFYVPHYDESIVRVFHQCDAIYFQSFREAQGGFFFPSFRFREKDRLLKKGKLSNNSPIDEIVDIWWMQQAAQCGDMLAHQTISERAGNPGNPTSTKPTQQDAYYYLAQSILSQFGYLNLIGPELDRAKFKLDMAVRLNPQVIASYLEAGKQCGLVTEPIERYLSHAAKVLDPVNTSEPTPTKLSA